MSKICKILSNLRWFEIGTSGLNQNFGSIQARAIILIFISNFQNSIIFKSGRIKAAYKFVVFRKIVTLLRKWRHCSASFQKNSKVKPYKERRSPYLNHVFYFKSISCLVFAWEHNKKDTFLQFFQTPPNVLLYIIIYYYIWVTKPQGLVMRSSLWFLSTSGTWFFSSLLYILIVNVKYTPVFITRFLI